MMPLRVVLAWPDSVVRGVMVHRPNFRKYFREQIECICFIPAQPAFTGNCPGPICPSGGREETRLEPDRRRSPGRRSTTIDHLDRWHAETVQFLRPATSDTASLLRDVPGVSLYGAGGVSSLPSIRGLADDRLRIQGRRYGPRSSCPNHTNPPLSYIDPSNVGTLKVFAGITPVSVGGDSIGGTIIADTVVPGLRRPASRHFTKVRWARSTAATTTRSAAICRRCTRPKLFNINYNGSYSKADNYTAGGDFKTTTATGRVGHTLPFDEAGSTAYETQTHNLGMALKAGGDVFRAQLGYQKVPEQLYPNQRMDMLDNIQKRINLSWLGGFDWGDLETRVYHETVEHFMDFRS